jgi:hypothetical protein
MGNNNVPYPIIYHRCYVTLVFYIHKKGKRKTYGTEIRKNQTAPATKKRIDMCVFNWTSSTIWFLFLIYQWNEVW